MAKKRVFAYCRVATKEQISDCPANGTPVRLVSNYEGGRPSPAHKDLPLKEDKK